jgi:hypothetical protein
MNRQRRAGLEPSGLVAGMPPMLAREERTESDLGRTARFWLLGGRRRAHQPVGAARFLPDKLLPPGRPQHVLDVGRRPDRPRDVRRPGARGSAPGGARSCSRRWPRGAILRPRRPGTRRAPDARRRGPRLSPPSPSSARPASAASSPPRSPGSGFRSSGGRWPGGGRFRAGAPCVGGGTGVTAKAISDTNPDLAHSA